MEHSNSSTQIDFTKKRKNTDKISNHVNKKYRNELEFVDCSKFDSYEGDEMCSLNLENNFSKEINTCCNLNEGSNHEVKNFIVNDLIAHVIDNDEVSPNLKSCDLPVKDKGSEILKDDSLFVRNVLESEYAKCSEFQNNEEEKSVKKDKKQEISPYLAITSNVNEDTSQEILPDLPVPITTNVKEEIPEDTGMDVDNDSNQDHTSHSSESSAEIGPESEENFRYTYLADFEVDEIDYLPNIEGFQREMKIEVEEHILQEEKEEELNTNFTQYKVKCEIEETLEDGNNKVTHKKAIKKLSPGKKSQTITKKQSTKNSKEFLTMMSALNQFDSYNPFYIPAFRDESVCKNVIVNENDTVSQNDEAPQVMQCRECKQIKLSVKDCIEHTSECKKIISSSCKSHSVKKLQQIYMSKFHCPLCSSQFSTLTSCRLHLTTTHSEKSEQARTIFIRSINLFYCHACCGLYHEKQLNTNLTTNTSEQVAPSRPDSNVNDVVLSRRYECPRCDKVFDNLTNIRLHIQTHYLKTTSGKEIIVERNNIVNFQSIKRDFDCVVLFKCSSCQITFNAAKHAISHYSLIHKNIVNDVKFYKCMRYNCKWCFASFNSTSQCILHNKKCTQMEQEPILNVSGPSSVPGFTVTTPAAPNSNVNTHKPTISSPNSPIRTVTPPSNLNKSMISTNMKTTQSPSKPIQIEQEIPVLPSTSSTSKNPSLINIKPTNTNSAQIRFKCPVCIEHYATKFSCKNHIRKCHPDSANLSTINIEIVPVYQCKKCKTICISRHQFEFHISSCISHAKNSLTVRRYFCPRCKHHYSNIKLCVEHIKLNHPIHCNLLIKDITSTLFEACDNKFGFMNKLLDADGKVGEKSSGEEEDVDVDIMSDSEVSSNDADNPKQVTPEHKPVIYDELLKQDIKLFSRTIVLIEKIQIL